MAGTVTVTVELFGPLGRGPAGKRLTLVVPARLADAVAEIRRRLVEDSGIHPGFFLLLDGRNVTALLQRDVSAEVSEGALFKAIPQAQGG